MLAVCLQITGFNILLPNFINDLKIIDYRKFSLIQQSGPILERKGMDAIFQKKGK